MTFVLGVLAGAALAAVLFAGGVLWLGRSELAKKERESAGDGPARNPRGR